MVDNTTNDGALSACADAVANDCSLRGAIGKANAAAGANTITFDATVFSTPQTIVVSGTALTINDSGNAALTIIGPGANLLTVSGNNAVQIFSVSSDDTASISGMTLTLALGGAISNSGNLTVTSSTFSSNTDGNGGAISNSLSLTVNGCTFTNNTATSGSATGLGGGAIYSNGASATVMISDSVFTGNAETGGSGGGGAIRNRGGTINITNSTFSSNTAVDGGGAIQNSDTMSISGSTFTSNSTSTSTSSANGGGISNTSGGELTITDTLITANSAVINGGGISYEPNASTGTSLTVINSTISNNTANSDSNTTGDGGGLFLAGTGSVTISGSTINGNRANAGATGSAGDGGGIDVSIVLNMTNSTVSGNNAGRNGGGIYASGVSSDIVTIISSTIVNNTAAVDGGGVNRASTTNPVNFSNTIVANNTDDGTAPDIFGTVNSNGHNLIESTTGATITGDTATNITGLDPNLGDLQNNGGPTFTHALLSPGPAIDKGASGSLNTDQRGSSRPVDDPSIPNATGGDGADIGAFEVQQFSAATYEGIETGATGTISFSGRDDTEGKDPPKSRLVTDLLWAAQRSSKVADGCFDLRSCALCGSLSWY